jgi:signal transduction histidine kinase
MMNPFGRLRSLRHRVFAAVMLTTVSALLIAGSMMVAIELQSYRARVISDMTAQAEMISYASTPALQFNDVKLADDNLALLRTRPTILAAAIYSPTGSLFSRYRQTDDAGSEYPAIPAAEGYEITGNRLRLFHRIVANNEIVGTVYLEVRYRLYDILRQQAVLMLSATAVALIISMFLSLWLQQRLTGPVLNVANLAQRIAKERDYSLRADKTTDDEIGVLVDAFNELVAEVDNSKDEMRRANVELQRQVEERAEAEEEVQRLNSELETRVAARTEELERAIGELEAFSYSVSHDLRAPLRAIDGFSQALMEDCADRLNDEGLDYLKRVRSGAQRMGHLIDDLLKLSQISRTQIHLRQIDISALAAEVLEDLKQREPSRQIESSITSGLLETGDVQLLRIALENLLGNALKYSSRRKRTEIEFGMRRRNSALCYFVRDNGVGFDMKYADKLFGAFQRLHDSSEYPGTGIGLATVQRIIRRHGGDIWAESEVDNGTTFYFTIQTGSTHNEDETDPAG